MILGSSFANSLKKISLLAIFFTLPIALTLLNSLPASAADTSKFNPGYIISDDIFYNPDTMGPAHIQQFLSSKVPSCDTNGTRIYSGSTTRAQYGTSRGYPPPYTCVKDYVGSTSQKSPDSYCRGYSQVTQSASDMIYGVAKSCDINPQVLIVLLQKEQGLITDDWPWSIQYRSATGMGCPDTAACDSQYYGFFNQIYGAARQYKMYRANPNSYSYVAGRNNYIQWSPNAACGGSTVYIHNQATAGLYNYTPYRPNQAALAAGYGSGDGCSAYGNRNFWLYFSDWFGSPTGDSCLTSYTPLNTDVIFQENRGRPSTGVFTIYSGTATGCVEFHRWNTGFGSWLDHIASNSSSTSPADSQISFADINGDGSDEAVLVGLRNTGSGMVEFHVWDNTFRRWSSHTATTQPGIDPSVSSVQFADVNGDGKDEALLIGQANGSTSTGKVEFHVWNYGFGSWRDHTVSNSSTLDMGVSSIQFADVDGDNRDEALLIGQGNGSTSTGNIEFHIWNHGFGSWRDHVTSNSSTLDPNLSVIRFSDVNGDNRDEGVLIGRRPPTGSGMIEFHVWDYNLRTWRQHTASNQSVPTQ